MATATQTVHARSERRRSGNLSEPVLRVLLYLAVILGAVIFAIPFYWMLRTALMPKWQVLQFPPAWIPAELVWTNFLDPFKVFPFGRWFLNSAIVSIASALGTAISASMVGFSFARLRFPLRDTLFVIVLATIILPEHVKLVPSYLLFTWLGWVDTFLPLIVPNLLAPAFFVFMMRQFFMTIPKDMDDAAYIDGCTPLGVFWRIHLPMSMAAVGVVIIFMITFTWNDFLYPLIYLHKAKDFTIAIGLRLFQGQLSNNLQQLMAASLLAILPTLLVFFFAQRYFVQGIVVTGVK
jgi:ABC-type glycerol-3-phosphate transport system permease component